MSKTRYFITYSIVALMIVGFFLVMREASKFDYRYVNKCHEIGGVANIENDMKQCTKDGKLVIIE